MLLFSSAEDAAMLSENGVVVFLYTSSGKSGSQKATSAPALINSAGMHQVGGTEQEKVKGCLVSLRSIEPRWPELTVLYSRAYLGLKARTRLAPS